MRCCRPRRRGSSKHKPPGDWTAAAHASVVAATETISGVVDGPSTNDVGGFEDAQLGRSCIEEAPMLRERDLRRGERDLGGFLGRGRHRRVREAAHPNDVGPTRHLFAELRAKLFRSLVTTQIEKSPTPRTTSVRKTASLTIVGSNRRRSGTVVLNAKESSILAYRPMPACG